MLSQQRGEIYEYKDVANSDQFFSVSQVLGVLDQPYANVAPAVLDRTSERGVDVHEYFSFYLGSRRGLCPRPDPLPDEFAGYGKAIERWADDYDVFALRIAEASRHPKLPYAGEPDALCLYRKIRRGIGLPDLKTTACTGRLHRVQVQAYHRLVNYTEARRLSVLYVFPTGDYREIPVEPNPTDWGAFVSALNVLIWRKTK